MGADKDISDFVHLAGATIKRQRKEAGLTQPELAKKAGVSESIISLLEREQRSDVSVSTLIRILGVFHGHLTMHLPQ